MRIGKTSLSAPAVDQLSDSPFRWLLLGAGTNPGRRWPNAGLLISPRDLVSDWPGSLRLAAPLPIPLFAHWARIEPGDKVLRWQDRGVSSHAALRGKLRAIPVLATQPLPFPVEAAPDDPSILFVSWLDDAIDAGIAEPHAMTLSTCGPDGSPYARTLILKDLDAEGWWFGGQTGSPKGRQLASVPAAASTFYWPTVGRQVRVRGPVRQADPERSLADFWDRSAGSRAVALTSRQSTPAPSLAQIDAGVRESQRIAAEADPTRPTGWTLWGVAATDIEFWQADPGRQHMRLRYTRAAGGDWLRDLLWP